MTQKKIERIKADYLNGMTYKDIFKNYNINLSDLKKIIHKYKLTRDKKEILKGNKNALGNKGGKGQPNNKNAVVTGEYENIYDDVLTTEELNLYNNYKISDDDIDNLLIKEYITEYTLLTIREKRMMKRIKVLEEKEKDMKKETKNRKNKSVSNDTTDETITEAESTLKTIQRIEDGLTRVQDTKRKSRENMIKLGFSKKTLELKERQIDNECW